MALNEIKKDTDSISVLCDAAVESGDLIAVNSGLAGVAEVDAHTGDVSGTWTTVRTRGIFQVPVGSAATPAIGEAVFITPPAAGEFEKVTLAATGTKIGTIISIPPGGTHLWIALNA